jgi:hypothetical protein
MEPGCIGKSNTNNLPAPTDLIENPYGKKKLFFNDATQKSARVVPWGIAIELEPREPIFEKCPHLREKGGVLTLKTPRWVCAYPYSPQKRILSTATVTEFSKTFLDFYKWPDLTDVQVVLRSIRTCV